MTRVEFSAAVKREAASRSDGRCECHLMPEDIRGRFPADCDRVAAEFDHLLACILGGEATLENCAHLCSPCHRIKTATDVAYKAKRARHKPDRERRNKRKANPSAKIQSRGFSKQKRGFRKPEGKQ
mgnify:FL=1